MNKYTIVHYQPSMDRWHLKRFLNADNAAAH